MQKLKATFTSTGQVRRDRRQGVRLIEVAAAAALKPQKPPKLKTSFTAPQKPGHVRYALDSKKVLLAMTKFTLLTIFVNKQDRNAVAGIP